MIRNKVPHVMEN
jgi:hypothetical protein